MKSDYRLLFGPLATTVLLVGIIGLAFLVPGYNPIQQTVSEIGEADSPARLPFAIMLWIVAACLIVFGLAVRALSIESGSSPWAAYLIGATAVSAAGIGVFAYPHPLHNVSGLSELVGYQAPLALAATWRGEPRARSLVLFSWIMGGLVWAAIVLNLTTFYRHGPIWAEIKPVYGLCQRALFATWFGWCAGAGVLLFRWRSPPTLH